MKKQPSIVIISKRGENYYCSISGVFGGGFSGAYAGETPEEAASFAIIQQIRYVKNNPMGGEMILPSEVKIALESMKTRAPL